MEILSKYQDPVGLLLFGGLLLYLGLLLLGEYRKVFFQNPLAVMSLEVLFQILRLGAPGYLSMVLIVCSVFFFVAGIGLFIAISCLLC
jgi:hypothetical protein